MAKTSDDAIVLATLTLRALTALHSSTKSVNIYRCGEVVEVSFARVVARLVIAIILTSMVSSGPPALSGWN